MFTLVPEVHLFICLDPRVSPGPVLHCLDVARAQDWQQETVLICDESWRPFVNIDQPVLFIDRQKILSHSSENTEEAMAGLEGFLEQLDHFEIKQITQLGDLYWGRWLQAYFENEEKTLIQVIDWQSQAELSSLQVVNDLAHELALDMTSMISQEKKGAAIYIDPYQGSKLSAEFLRLIKNTDLSILPHWLNVVVHEKDFQSLAEFGLEDYLVDFSEFEMSLFNQSVLCFSDQSVFAQTSRSYNVALFQVEGESSLFVPGDIKISTNEDIHISELTNILAYWRTKRLKELAFQWLNMGVEISCIEDFHGRVIKRNLLNYSSDLYHSQILVNEFLKRDSLISNARAGDLVHMMRRKVHNDPYALSFSLKLLLMIVERMIASAECGERLFQRLGSDYHRVVIGEALIEGLIEQNASRQKVLDIKKQLNLFHDYLLKIDHSNDQIDSLHLSKESA